MQVKVVDSIAAISERDWDRLAGPRYPFLKHSFLHAAESTGCVADATGWQPRHIAIYDRGKKLVAAMPLYEKSHSWGEFVFDWAWAQAYQRAGLSYYPKLISAIPFTPAPAPKLLHAGPVDAAYPALLLDTAIGLAGDSGCSSLHIQFPVAEELRALQAAGLMLRKDCQFHWHNQGYRSFDDFLATFSSAKRKKAKRDRRHVSEQGITFRWLHGGETDRNIWKEVHELICLTFLRRGAMPYYDIEFFLALAARQPDNILIVLAEQNANTIAAAVFYEGAETLYGRYWGSSADYNALHFETCYYQGIEYCIARGKKIFEPGTQGEHKISRGFVPVTTWSAHWLERPEFFQAIGHYLDDEKQHIDRYIEAVGTHSPYRSNSDPVSDEHD